MAEIKERLEEFGREELVKISKSGASPATDVRKTREASDLINENVACVAVSEMPVYTTESRTLDRRNRGESRLMMVGG